MASISRRALRPQFRDTVSGCSGTFLPGYARSFATGGYRIGQALPVAVGVVDVCGNFYAVPQHLLEPVLFVVTVGEGDLLDAVLAHDKACAVATQIIAIPFDNGV